MRVIYSFHMPVFILLSAITCRYATDCKSFVKNTIHAAKHLLIPMLIIFSLNIVVEIAYNPSLLTNLHFWRDRLKTFIFFRLIDTGVDLDWFFIALFSLRIVFDIFQMMFSKKTLLPLVILASAVGVAMGKHANHPYTWSFDIALAFMPFMYIGYCWKDITSIQLSKGKKIVCMLIVFFVWLMTEVFILTERIDVATRYYPSFPFDFFLAIAGSFCVIAFAKLLEKAKIFVPLQFLGRWCIYFYCVHCVDYIWQDWWNITNSNFINYLTRVAIDLAFFLLIVGIHFAITQCIKYRRKKRQGT